MDAELREQLTRVTQNVRTDEHRVLIDAIRAQIPHSIFPVESKYSIDRYTCVMHAFELVEDPTYVHIAEYGLGQTYAGPEFIEFVLNSALVTERLVHLRMQDDLVMHFEQDNFFHIGTLRSHDRVISKWGTGHLWEHGLWEVPLSYGSRIRFFEALPECAGLQLFIQFAES